MWYDKPVGPTATVAKLVPAQAFHMITPITPFYPVLTKWTWHRVLADPMEREIIDFIVTSRLANRGLHPLAEGPLMFDVSSSLDIIPSLLPSLPLQIVSELLAHY